MAYALPARIMDYRVSASSPTAELLTLGQIFSEVGAYVSTIIDRSHLAMARKCATRLKKVVRELTARNCIQSADDLHKTPAYASHCADLSSLTINQLHSLYRLRAARRDDRAAAGREPLTYYYERQIVREMLRRKAANKDEQLKIDYCAVTYANDLENLSAILSLPLKTGATAYPDPSKQYTAQELAPLIAQHRDYRDIAGREILIQYADMAIDHVEQTEDLPASLGLITELAETGRQGIIRIPQWITAKLQQALAQPAGRRSPHASDSDLRSRQSISRDAERAVAMLTLQMITGDPTLQRKAARLINRCYRAALDPSTPLDARADALRCAVDCREYVTRYSPRAAAAAAAQIASLASRHKDSLRHIFTQLGIPTCEY